ncbi:MAG: phage portal protein [Fimbriimonadaceae bacterium]
MKNFSFLQHWLGKLPLFRTASRGSGGFGSAFSIPGSNRSWRVEAEPFYRNGVVSAMIGWAGRTLSQSRVGVEDERAAEDTDLARPEAKVLRYGCPYYDFSTLIQATALSLICQGNAYWLKLRNRRGEVVGYFYLPHQDVTPEWEEGSFVSGYRVAGLVPAHFEAHDVVHFRLGIDPKNARLGLSPLGAVLREIVTLNELSGFTAAVLRSPTPGAVVTPLEDVETMSYEERMRLKHSAQDAFSGEGAGGWLFLNYRAQIQPLRWSPRDVDASAMSELPINLICAAVGIDPMVLGLPSPNKTYSNMAEARKIAEETWLRPTQSLIAQQLTSASEEDVFRAPDGSGSGLSPGERFVLLQAEAPPEKDPLSKDGEAGGSTGMN